MIARLEKGIAVPGNEETFMHIYPMGFIPALKEQLVKNVGDNLTRLTTLANVAKSIEALGTSSSSELDLTSIFNAARVLSTGLHEGIKITEEELEFVTHMLRTDEELAVIFAKISRKPESFQDVARSVTEEGAADFHKKWTVSVEGYGHASVAEHAVVHLAVENVASLDGDALTDNRLASFTEFSARFKGPQEVGWFIPEAVAKDPQLLLEWNRVHEQLFLVHDRLFEMGKAYIETDEAKGKHPQRRVKGKTVADQIKNLMPASRLTSIGVTMNAREGENTIRKMLSAPYESIQEMGRRLKEASLKVAPTLVKYAERNDYLVATHNSLAQTVERHRLAGYVPEISEEGKLVELLDFDPLAEEKFITATLYENSQTGSYRELLGMVSNLSPEERNKISDDLLGTMGRWDSPIRMLEFAGDITWEIPGMTYGDWREAKRHRMTRYTAKSLDVQWGYMVPPLVKEMDQSKDEQFHGSENMLREAIGEVDDLFEKVAKIDPYAAQYLVTRLHYRPALMAFNFREAYQFINLRTGPTAHPFIRRLAFPMFDELQRVQPNLVKYLGLKLAIEGRPAKDFLWTV